MPYYRKIALAVTAMIMKYDSPGVAVMLEIMGEQDGLAFMKKLAAKDLYMP
jgi:hypothetical protein